MSRSMVTSCFLSSSYTNEAVDGSELKVGDVSMTAASGDIVYIGSTSQFETVNAYSGTAIVHGPQGDVVRIENFARCVRKIE